MRAFLQIEPAYRDAFFAAGLRDFDSFMQAAAGPAVSRHRHRETVPIEVNVDGDARRFFLKRVFRVPAAHVWHPMLRGKRSLSQPLREWDACGALREAGLPAMRRAAVGERRRLGLPVQAFVVVEASPLRHTIEEWLIPGFERPRPIDAEARIALWRGLGALLRRLSACGADWLDLESKHIFAEPVERGGATAWEFCLIDLERVVMREGLKGQAEAKLLRKFQNRLIRSLSPICMTNEERTAFLGTPDGNSASNGERRDGAQNGLFESDMDRPRLPDGYMHPRRWRCRRVGDFYAEARYVNGMTSSGLSSIDAVFSRPLDDPLSKPGLAGYRDRARLSLKDEQGKTRVVYLKRYRRPPAREQMRRIVEFGIKRGASYREARFTRILLVMGVPTMNTVAIGELMRRGIEERGFIITEEVPGQSLEKVAAQQAEGTGAPVSPADRHEIIRQLALIVRRLHNEELFHRDLYLCHVFLTRNSDGGIVLQLIDLARMIRRRVNQTRWIVKDLAALDYSSPPGVVTRADRARFLYHYLAASATRPRRPRGRAMQEFHRLRMAIARRNRKTAAHDAKRQSRMK